MKKVSTSLNALYNEKVKSKQSKSKKGKKGASIKVEVSNGIDTNGLETFIERTVP